MGAASGCTAGHKGFEMIIEPEGSEKWTGGDGQLWVSYDYIRKQTARPSTNGWTQLVLETVSDGRSVLRKNGVFYKLDDVVEAFKLVRNPPGL